MLIPSQNAFKTNQDLQTTRCSCVLQRERGFSSDELQVFAL